MPVYMVERVLPGATVQSVEMLQTVADRACRAFTQNGKPVRYLRSTFTPGESRCRCLFEAPNADLVRELNEAAQLPYSRIILALDLESSSGASAGGTPSSAREKNCSGS
jgi:Protein of unknown function (DUF4242)